MKVLILCTGNSCRSQMAHSFLKSFDRNLLVCSAGIFSTDSLNSGAVIAMAEVGLDISNYNSESVEKYTDEPWDYVITMCGGANENCPTFSGKVKHRVHIEIDDPSEAIGPTEFINNEYRRVRDDIKSKFYEFYINRIKSSEGCPCGANDFCKCE